MAIPAAVGLWVLLTSDSSQEKLIAKLSPWIGEWPAKLITALTPLGWWYPAYYWINAMRDIKPATTEEIDRTENEIRDRRQGLNEAIMTFPEITDDVIARVNEEARIELDRVRRNWTLIDRNALIGRIETALAEVRVHLQETKFYEFERIGRLENRVQSLERVQLRFRRNQSFEVQGEVGANLQELFHT